MDVREKLSSEKRLIDANALMDVIRQHEYRLATKQGSIDYGMFTLGIQQAVDEQPTVDAVEVVHGRWEEMHYEGGILDGTNFDRCSVCGYERVFDDPALKTAFKYCPNCGAKMNGGED